MSNFITWLLANWKTVVVDGLALDRALLIICPGNSVLTAIGNVLSGFVPAQLKAAFKRK